MRRLSRWLYLRRFAKAERILRQAADRHKAAGHEVYYTVVNETDVHLTCVKCPENLPLRQDIKSKPVVYRDRFGRFSG